MTDTQQCLAAYGNPVTREFIDKWLKRFELPADVQKVWPRYPGINKPITAIYMNTFAYDSLIAVFRELIKTKLVKELKTYDGCLNVRLKRGLNDYSIHSWGLALDFNAALNPLNVKVGSRPNMFTHEFLEVWRRHGWTCGASFSRPDGMHFQFTSTFPKAI
jgi:hypothetical protein